MVGGEVFERFLQEAPACVMVRATLENMFSAAAINDLFRVHSQQQYERELLFSSVVDVMSLVVAGVHPSVHAAYQRRRQEIGVSVKSLYNKLNGIEPTVSQALVRHTADVAAEMLRHWQLRPPCLKGYRTKIVDGNHLAGTDHRLDVLRTEGAAALPGSAPAGAAARAAPTGARGAPGTQSSRRSDTACRIGVGDPDHLRYGSGGLKGATTEPTMQVVGNGGIECYAPERRWQQFARRRSFCAAPA